MASPVAHGDPARAGVVRAKSIIPVNGIVDEKDIATLEVRFQNVRTRDGLSAT
jgi:hypothetical protein